MLSKPIDEIIYENGVAVGVKSQGEVSSFNFLDFKNCYIYNFFLFRLLNVNL